MGTEFYSYEEAQQRLGKSYRTIKLYAKQGLLNKVYTGNKAIGVTKDSVENMLLATGLDGDPFNRFSVVKHGKSIQKLEERINRIEIVLGLVNKTLKSITPEYAESLWMAAKEMDPKKEEWTFQQVKTWIELLGGFEEETLTTIAERVVSARPWEPFLGMANRISDYLSSAKYAGNETAEDLSFQMDETLKKLRSTILMWALQKEGDVLKRAPGMSVRDVLSELGIGYRGKRAILKAISEGRGR